MSRGKPCSFDRDEALQKAMELFWRRGYEATGMTQLLEHMGIPRQSFYNTFGNKENVLFEAIDLYSIQLHLMLRSAVTDVQSPLEKIDRIFEMWKKMDTNGCFIGNCVAELGTTHDLVAEKMASKLQSLRTIFGDIFQEAIDCGELPKERDARILGNTLLTYGQGLALIHKSGTDKDLINQTMDVMKRSLKQ